MTHRADCSDCTWSFVDDDLVDVSDEMERHARKEQHHVDLDRAVATDGGDTEMEARREWALEKIRDWTEPTPDGEQSEQSALWTSTQRLKGDASKTELLERADVGPLVDDLVVAGEVVLWHGLVAPATDEHLKAIVQNEVEAEVTRTSLVGLCNTIQQGEPVEPTADQGDGIATDGGRDQDDEFTRQDAEQVSQSVAPVVKLAHTVDRELVDLAIRELSKREAAGPLLDPSGWMSGEGEATEKANKRLIAFRDFHDALTEIEEADDVDLVTDGGRDQDDEWYVVDEDRGAVVAGPFEEKDEAADDARDRTPDHIVVTEGALRMLEMASSSRIRWENDDVDVVTDGGQDVASEWILNCLDCDFRETIEAECHPRDGPPRAVRDRVTTHKGRTDESHIVRVEGRRTVQEREIDPSLVTDGGTAPRWRQAGVDVVQTHAGMGDQNPECENGTPGCPGPNPPGGVLPCGPCFLSGGGARAD